MVGFARNFVACLIALSLLACAALAGQPEVELSDAQYKKLDQFEAFALQKADKAFAADKRQAAAEYDAFILDNPRSQVLPYALLRKARCLQLANKRNAALKEYQSLIDYCPDQAQYAGAALFYIGQCHWDDGNPDKALLFWAKMSEHPEYSKHFLAATALNQLADGYMKMGNSEKAIEYCALSAVTFRKSNPEAARHAMYNQVVPYFIRTNPNEAKLRDFYVKVQTFEHDPHKVEPDSNTDARYWKKVREFIERHGEFNESQVELKRKHFGYWAQQMQGKFADNDDYQIDAANYKLIADNDAPKFIARLDEQFTKYQKEGDFDRINKWIRAYSRQKNKALEYYQKLDFAKMSNPQIRQLMAILFDDVKDPALAKNVFGQLRLSKLADNEKVDVSRYLWHRDETLVKRCCQEIPEPLGQMELLRYFHWKRDHAQGLPLCDTLSGVPDFAKEALWAKAELLHHSHQFEKAIAVYRESDNPPEGQFRIAECLQRLGKIQPAVAQLQEIQNFFKDKAPEAAIRTAWIYRDAKDKAKFESSLRAVLKKYPKSGQSSTAHQELEKLGVVIGGGVDAE
jgi:TolA-binding protein